MNTASDAVSTDTAAPQAAPALDSRIDYHLLMAALVAHSFIWFMGTSNGLLDVDVANLTYGMVEFNLAHFNPHPPGYLPYILLLRAVHALRFAGDLPVDRVITAQLLSLAFALAAVWQVFAACRRLYTQVGAAGWAAMFVALHPIMLFHSVDAQTHTSEAFAAALLLNLALAARARPSPRSAVVLGLALALGAGFRPSFVLFGVPVIVLTYGRRHFAALVLAGATSVVGALIWFIPTIILSGGYELWSRATNSLVHDAFISTSSPLAESSLGILILANELGLGVAAAQIFLPVLLAWLLLRGGRARLAPRHPRNGSALGSIALVVCAAQVVYYALTFFSEPGYLLTCVPIAALLVGGLGSGPRLYVPQLAAVLLALASGLIPQVPIAIKVASLDSWRLRDELVHVSLQLLNERLPPGAHVLVISDFPDITIARQLPIHLENVDVLMVADDALPWHPTTGFAYVTRADSVPIPTDHLLSNEGARSLRVDAVYDYIYVDEMVTEPTMLALVAQSRCPVSEYVNREGDYLLLPAACLMDQMFTMDDVGFGFRRVEPSPQ